MSPSEGIKSPASTSTTSPTFKSSAGTVSITASCAHRRVHQPLGDGVGAGGAQESACALPRPSATASAKVANSTVNHSHSAIWPENMGSPPPVNSERAHRKVTSAATTSVTKITGLAAR